MFVVTGYGVHMVSYHMHMHTYMTYMTYIHTFIHTYIHSYIIHTYISATLVLLYTVPSKVYHVQHTIHSCMYLEFQKKWSWGNVVHSVYTLYRHSVVFLFTCCFLNFLFCTWYLLVLPRSLLFKFQVLLCQWSMVKPMHTGTSSWCCCFSLFFFVLLRSFPLRVSNIRFSNKTLTETR